MVCRQLEYIAIGSEGGKVNLKDYWLKSQEKE